MDIYDDYIQLKIEGLTRGRELRDAYILVLGAKDESQYYPVLVPREGYEQLSAALNHNDFTCSHLMHRLAARVGMSLKGVRIMQPRDGVTQALVDFELISEVVTFAAPAAEAIVAALEVDAPIWVRRPLYESQTQMHGSGGNMALPLSAMADNLLKEALQSAVEEENYELASVLDHELKRRKEHEKQRQGVLSEDRQPEGEQPAAENNENETTADTPEA